jgi:hypothetical protein
MQNGDAEKKKLKMHAVSLTPQARVHAGSLTTHAQGMRGGVTDTACTMHAGSLIPHAMCMKPHAKYDTACTGDERFERSWQPLKGISTKNICFPELPYPTPKNPS